MDRLVASLPPDGSSEGGQKPRRGRNVDSFVQGCAAAPPRIGEAVMLSASPSAILGLDAMLVHLSLPSDSSTPSEPSPGPGCAQLQHDSSGH
mmetsp:Transcript_86185/g.230155  ORF Transcript_86185/g.230155 Transcript_86185/m.230155 type:complete len:92 (+) Transcript_86185:2346-2621(+)